MIEYRRFLNTDPPAIADIWRGQNTMRGLAQNVSTMVLEELVFSKPYYDPNGFFVATENGNPVGFVHAANGPNRDFSSTANEHGIICMLMVQPCEQQAQIRAELLRLAEQYLLQKNVEVIHAIGCYPIAPFYLGLYGGSRVPGVLLEDKLALEFFEEAGYKRERRQLIMQCQLSDFRPRIDRQTMIVRRKFQVQATFDPPPRNWWEACTIGCKDRTRFEIYDRASSKSRGQVTTWDMGPLSRSWGVNAIGLFDLEIDSAFRRQGLASFLVGEAIRQMQEHSVTLAEIQTSSDDEATVSLFENLGFALADEAILLSRTP